ncbi:MAG: flavodoxin family protein [Clostridium sp.]|uniref:flavodoxin family protein n=1 Tax=Clostridium sp. TaxID=1506 RepID=UPI003F33B3E4
MKCVVIHGSPRRGNTWDVLNKVIENMKKTDESFEFEIIELAKEKIPNCTGCFNCILKGEELCPHKDKIKTIVEKINEADGLILTTPVYAMNMTGTLKGFLDHIAYKFHRPTFFKKKALIIVTTAGAGQKKVAKDISEVLGHIGINSIRKLAIAYRGIELNNKNKSIIDKVSKKFAIELKSGKIKKPNLKAVFMYNAWKGMAMNSDKESADYKHWKWKSIKNIPYDENVKVGFIAKGVAKFSYKLMWNLTKNKMK